MNILICCIQWCRGRLLNRVIMLKLPLLILFDWRFRLYYEFSWWLFLSLQRTRTLNLGWLDTLQNVHNGFILFTFNTITLFIFANFKSINKMIVYDLRLIEILYHEASIYQLPQQVQTTSSLFLFCDNGWGGFNLGLEEPFT